MVLHPARESSVRAKNLTSLAVITAQWDAFNRIAEVALGDDQWPADVVVVVQHVGVNRRDAKVELVVIGVYLEESCIVFVDEEGVNIFQSETIGCVAILERDAIGSSHRADRGTVLLFRIVGSVIADNAYVTDIVLLLADSPLGTFEQSDDGIAIAPLL